MTLVATRMAGLKSIVLIVTLCNLAFALGTTKDLRISKQWSADKEGISYLTKVNNDIVTVSIEDNNALQVTFPPETKKSPCQIPLQIPLDRFVDHHIWARELGNGKIIVTTEILSTIMGKKAGESNLYIVVDPTECTAKMIEVPGTEITVLHQRLPVAFDNTFDVFPVFRGSKDPEMRKIKRFSDDGKEIIVPDSISSDMDLDSYNSYVHPFNSKDPSAGYFVVQNRMDEGSNLTLLNSKLEVVKTIERKGVFVITASTSFNSITICHIKEKRVICELLDKLLNTKFEVPMMQQQDANAYNAWAANLPDGGAMVVLEHGHSEGKMPPTNTEWAHIQRIFKDGSTSHPVELDKNDNASHKPRGFVMSNGEYCAANIATKWSKERNPIIREKVPSTVKAICIDTKSE